MYDGFFNTQLRCQGTMAAGRWWGCFAAADFAATEHALAYRFGNFRHILPLGSGFRLVTDMLAAVS